MSKLEHNMAEDPYMAFLPYFLVVTNLGTYFAPFGRHR